METESDCEQNLKHDQVGFVQNFKTPDQPVFDDIPEDG